MKPVKQTKAGPDGNCFQAAIASLLELPLEAVPDFVGIWDTGPTKKTPAWLREFGSWAAKRGCVVVAFKWTDSFIGPRGTYFIAVGPSPVYEGLDHAVIASATASGALIEHDPGETGITEIVDVYMVFPAVTA